MNQNLYGDYKAAGALAGVFSGINQKQEEEKTNLLNTYQGLKNKEQEYTSAEAQAKMQNPQYLQMKLQNDMAKFGKDTSINELESGYNKSTRAVLDLQIAAQQGPEALQQKALGYLQELGIDPNSKDGQLMLQDPVGFAQKTQQYFAAAATNNADYQQKYKLKEAEAGWGMEKQKAGDAAQMERAQLQANTSLAGQKYAADRGLTGNMISYSKDLRGELDSINSNLTKLETKEVEQAIIQDFIQRNNKQPSKAEIEKEKTSYRKTLENRKSLVEADLATVRGSVNQQLGLKSGQGAGNGETTIKYDANGNRI
jgi:hypothetical protein